MIENTNKILTFNVIGYDEAQSFAMIVLHLNKVGVPYTVNNSGENITIEIGEGY